MKKTFRVHVKIKGCSEIFGDNMPVGVIAYQDIEFDVPEKKYESNVFIMELNNRENELREDTIETYTTEII